MRRGLRCREMRRASPSRMDRRSLALFALTLGVFLVTLNVTVVVVALPSLQADLHIRTDEAAWVIDAYNLVGASLLLCAGFLADRFGRKRMLCTGYALVRDRRAAVRARAERRLADRVPRADGGRRHRAHADEPLDRREPLSGAARAGARDRPLGHLVGSRHGTRADRRRRAHRLVRLALGVRGERHRRACVALAIVIRVVPRSRSAVARRIDVAGQVLVAGFLATLTYALIEAPRFGFGSPRIVRRRALALVLFVAFIVVELRVDEPLIDLGFFRDRQFAGAIFLCAGDVLHLRRVHLLQRALPAGRARLLGARRRAS